MTEPLDTHPPDRALVERVVAHDVATTVRRMRDAAGARGMTVFTVIDHAAAARQVGLELQDEVLLIFGAPQVGTALMQAAPRAGLDLPLHVLVWDDDGATRVSYRPPGALLDEHRLDGLGAVVDRMATALEAVVSAAA